MISHKLVGNAMQMVVCQLPPGQTIYSDSGKFLWKTANVSMETKVAGPQQPSGGGFLTTALGAGKRMLTGQNLALQYYTATSGSGLATFSGMLPGEVRALEVGPGQGWITEHESFLAAESTVGFDIVYNGFRKGVMSGQGMLLQKHEGTGTLLVAAAGNFIELNPAQYGGVIQVHAGCVVAFADRLQYNVELIASPFNMAGLKTFVLGHDGFAMIRIEGDGPVLLQSVTIHSLAKALAKHMPHEDGGRDDGGGITGSILDQMF